MMRSTESITKGRGGAPSSSNANYMKKSNIDHHKITQFTLIAACLVSTAGLASLISSLYALRFIDRQIAANEQRGAGGSHHGGGGGSHHGGATDEQGYTFHLVVSSGCNALQDWQSYAWFYHVMASGFKGNVTRVASCETDEQAEAMRKLHKEQIQDTMSDRFNLHITPDYSHLVTPKYNFFNKPFGIRHWLEHGLGFASTNTPEPLRKTIFVLMDPDQFLMRPFVRDMTNEAELFMEPNGYRIVDEGQPFAAAYGFGGRWIRKINVKELLALKTTENAATSKLLSWDVDMVDRNYAIGPPYVVIAKDFYAIVRQWSDFVVPIYKSLEEGTGFLAEMWAYSTAAVHLNLPHQVSKSFMISDPGASEEAWNDWIDSRLVMDKNNPGMVDKAAARSVCSPNMEPMPHSMHFCQHYYLGPYFFSKYQVPAGNGEYEGEVLLSCEHPLYEEPPLDAASQYITALTLDGKEHGLDPKTRLRMAFGVCQMLTRLNDAVSFFKQNHCEATTANYDKVYVHELHNTHKKRKAEEKAAIAAGRKVVAKNITTLKDRYRENAGLREKKIARKKYP